MFLLKLRRAFTRFLWSSPPYPIQIKWVPSLMWQDILASCAALLFRLLMWTINAALKSIEATCATLDSATSWLFATGCEALHVRPCGVYQPRESAILVLGAHQGTSLHRTLQLDVLSFY